MGKKADIRISLDDVRRLQRMNPAQAYTWLVHFYIEAYEAGLREGEKEFDDAVILDEDAARERIGEEAYNDLIGGER